LGILCNSVLYFLSTWALVVHACNPSNLGGRDQEDCGLKPAWANSLRDPILKKSMIKKGGGVAQV
jgi:hypothetical protein